jgi:TetR/AcrR family transcriptional regulator, transcriptional repressor for nem operon
MARILKEDEYNARRNEILDYTLSLVYSKGYERMTIQDILDGIHISRGALYHYFDSKQALLEALIERMGTQGIQALLPIVQDLNLTAIQKMFHTLERMAQLKSAQKDLILQLLPAWISDDNAILRQKLSATTFKWAAQVIFEPIIQQGVQEQAFSARYPDQVAKIIVGIALTLSDAITELILAPHPDQQTFQKAQALLDTYFDSIERVLGAPYGSLRAFQVEDFKEWWIQPLAESDPP